MVRDKNIVELRPQLNLEFDMSSEVERFQNQTLRPILKLQNSLIINLIRDYLKVHKKNVELYTFTALRTFVKDTVGKDLFLRNSLIYIIVGLFTEEEFKFYTMNKKEVSKRILNMSIKRIQDQIELLA